MSSDVALLILSVVGNVILRWAVFRGSWWLTTRLGHLYERSRATDADLRQELWSEEQSGGADHHQADDSAAKFSRGH